jgi:hypothetical protein
LRGYDLIKYLKNIDAKFGANVWRGVHALRVIKEVSDKAKIDSYLGNAE